MGVKSAEKMLSLYTRALNNSKEMEALLLQAKALQAQSAALTDVVIARDSQCNLLPGMQVAVKPAVSHYF